ncbi:hypothetical protein THOG05_10001 [Vibrio rotiferianus]|nr:hypothetical protein THOG05_10001 [Vibrio rotiferianus]
MEKRTCFIFLETSPVNSLRSQMASMTTSIFTSRLLQRSALISSSRSVVKEIPDDAPSSLSGMTPFDFRVVEHHPQERGTSELGIFYFL